jgi:hypothetical protein
MVLPQHSYHLQSRYVTTVATDYLQPPVNYTLTPTALFDQYAGATAVHNSIAQQKMSHSSQWPTTDDPYSAQLETCAHGDIHPILPRLGLKKQKKTVQLDFQFLLLSLPDANQKKDSLYKVWPAVQKHLPDFPVAGPYCFQGDPHRAYAVNISFDSAWGAKKNPWKLTPGCVADLPCWPTEHPPKPSGGGGKDGPGDDGAGGMIWTILTTYGVYFLLVGLIISLTVNCQLSYQLQQRQRVRGEQEEQGGGGRRRRRVGSTPAVAVAANQEGLMEPLLSSTTNEDPTTRELDTQNEETHESTTTTADIGGEGSPLEDAAKDELQV